MGERSRAVGQEFPPAVGEALPGMLDEVPQWFHLDDSTHMQSVRYAGIQFS